MPNTNLIADAAALGATVVRAPGATIIIIPDRTSNGDELLPELEAIQLAKCSARTIRAARRAGDIVAYGKQRSRSYKRADVLAWIESRRVRPVAGADDADIERRVLRLARSA